jgi:hypothetical protein
MADDNLLTYDALSVMVLGMFPNALLDYNPDTDEILIATGLMFTDGGAVPLPELVKD